MGEFEEAGATIGKFALTKETMPIIKQMAEVMPGGFFFYREDERRDILYVNHVVLDIFGCDTLEEFKELTGNTFEGMVHPEDFRSIQDSIDEQIEADLDSKMDHVVYRITRKDGAIRWVDDYGHFSHSEDYGDIYYVFISDITEKHEAARIERELRANEAKNAFLFNISHDIRTPMNSIIGFTRLAKKHIDDPSVAGDYLDKVDKSAALLLSLIDDALEMNVIDSGKIELHPVACELHEEIETVVNMLRMEKEDSKLDIEIDVPSQRMEVDSLRLRRIMSNLIGNAIKFTPDDGKIRISARCLRVSDSGYARYEISVQDNGVGIAKDFQSRVFEAFERERSSTQSGFTGTGMGLAIVKGILDAMGGSIALKSEENQGSIFTIELPVRLLDKEQRTVAIIKPSEETERPDGSKRILLVDDIEINRLLAETMLSESGFLVESVTDGLEAVETVRSHAVGYYDLVLMDIQMPVMDGYEATRVIRAMNRGDTGTLPILALSANALPEDKEKSLESGMNQHISKPVDGPVLVAIIQSYLDGRF